jgi:hypothetical protein
MASVGMATTKKVMDRHAPDQQEEQYRQQQYVQGCDQKRAR